MNKKNIRYFILAFLMIVMLACTNLTIAQEVMGTDSESCSSIVDITDYLNCQLSK